jgi:hypothetical protein
MLSSSEMSDVPDIIKVDLDVKKFINDEIRKIPEYKKQLNKLSKEIPKSASKTTGSLPQSSQYVFLKNPKGESERFLKNPKGESERFLKNKINELETGVYLSEYIFLTEKMIDEYKAELRIPANISFFNNKKGNTKLDEIASKYIEIAKLYIPIKFHKLEKTAVVNKCQCGNSVDFIIGDNTISCGKCSIEIPIQSVQNSFKDIDRVNMSQKYKYKRKVHFKDTTNQYQGKQNKKSNDEKVYSELSSQFEKMGILVPEAKTWYEKHANITKDIIYMVLGEIKQNKRYEDINFIHNYFTGVQCPDISHLEDKLYRDFDRVVEVYDSLKVDRKNFLHSKYVLYQLLRIRDVKVDERDFDILKTRDRLVEHDEIWEKICKALQFQFKPCV